MTKSDLNISRSIEASRNSRSLENLDHHCHGNVQSSCEQSNSNKMSSKLSSAEYDQQQPFDSKPLLHHLNNTNSPDQGRSMAVGNKELVPGKSSSSFTKIENRKSTVGTSQLQQELIFENSGSFGIEGDKPSVVGSVGGSILYNTVNPLLAELHQHYTCHPLTPETLTSIEEQRSAFELAEQSSPGITEHFILLIFTQLNPYESSDFVKAYLDRLTRITKS